MAPLRSWADVSALRIKFSELSPALRQKSSWALYKVCSVLLTRGSLDPKPPKTTGTPREQLLAIGEYFYVDDQKKRDLLGLLTEFYLGSRVTITAVQVVQALAYYLARESAPSLSSWDEVDQAVQRVQASSGPWTRRIATAFCRLADALVAKGRLPPRERCNDFDAILRRLRTVRHEVDDIHRRLLVDLAQHGRRPTTLHHYVRYLNQFWEWATAQGHSHPAQLSSEIIGRYLAGLRRARRTRSYVQGARNCLRGYFAWLRRERLVVHQPVSPDARNVPVAVRVCSRTSFQLLARAIVSREIPPEAALILYLIMFHGFRNFEVTQARGAVFVAGAFRLTVVCSSSVRGPRPRRRAEVDVMLPTDRAPWLRGLVEDVLNERARKLKAPSNPYLFVSGGWRRSSEPIALGTVRAIVGEVSEQICGESLTPSLLRQTAATLAADAGDHTTCAFLGWSPGRAIQLAYATRETVQTARSTKARLPKRKLKGTSQRARMGISRTIRPRIRP